MGGSRVYVGVDVHKNFSFVCAMKENGEIILEKKVRTEELEKFLENIPGNRTIILEPTTTAINLARKLRKKNEVLLSHPYKTKLIAESKKKTDRVDAKVLADLARTNFLPTAYLPPDEIMELREIIRERIRLKKLSTSTKNRIHSILAKNGIKYDGNLFNSEGREFLNSLNNEWIDRYLRILSSIENEIKEIDKEIRQKCLENEETVLLTTIPGIGYFSALLIYAEIGDIKRFPNSKKLCSYAGLVPSTRQSGNKTITGRITKEGNKLLRWVLVQCAFVAIRKDERFRQFYERIKQRKGSQKAIVATARKLLTVVYAVLRDKKPYISYTPTSYYGEECTPVTNWA
ncbi:IS110 family transposase [Archaeoglobus veneficus]|uniref:Transposase IS116/IS110/IS902 family protein n=1 Tax=Archaeoglobus veneficus (strain DSM 11195 / SNP6) TaxID=693661 RepID=F2KMT2_ARCVS|nr:IS110 family transposase [Archaeoglobus veneficus]AEA46106.1 transposase IS116/IS110/IS902 family protein [Archaeoglobus veneficus SNP6]AEA47601.1 transposase IS116/IS110/IS902 family protein [Archaeoglobus veneficus SNP6]